jgi:uncharacterized low-complexity protein
MAKLNKTPLAAALGAAFLATVIAPAATADTNPFAATQLSSGYDLANYGKDAEGSCGGKKDAEGSCGGDKGKKEGSCGGDKGEKAEKEGSCGGDKGKKEGKCGEGKCGS